MLKRTCPKCKMEMEELGTVILKCFTCNHSEWVEKRDDNLVSIDGMASGRLDM